MADVLVHLFSGTIAGMSSVIVDYPLDTLKVKVQSGTHFHSHVNVSTELSNSASFTFRTSGFSYKNKPNLFSSLSQPLDVPSSSPFRKESGRLAHSNYGACILQSYRNGGIRSFYRGASIPLMAQGVENAVIFSVYRGVLDRIGTSKVLDDTSFSPWRSPETLFASACAGAAVSVILTPVEFVKCNLQVASPNMKGDSNNISVRRFVRKTWKTKGIKGFFKGHCGTMIRAIPGNVAYFVSFEQIKVCLGLQNSKKSSSLNTWEYKWKSMLAGGFSGCAYWTICFPADVVKTRMQVESYYATLSFRQAAFAHYNETGLSGLYRGWGVTAVRSFITSAIVFSVFEQLSSIHDTKVHRSDGL